MVNRKTKNPELNYSGNFVIHSALIFLILEILLDILISK
jgi:hypothetical protein